MPQYCVQSLTSKTPHEIVQLNSAKYARVAAIIIFYSLAISILTCNVLANVHRSNFTDDTVLTNPAGIVEAATGPV
jgi:hypothetical protein